MKPALASLPVTPVTSAVRGGFDLTALTALFVLTLRQHLRGRRLLVLSLLFLLPSAMVCLFRLGHHPPNPGHLEFATVFNLIPHALATLTALLYAAGMIQDEVEEQTLTYLLLRPLPRWALYLTKFVLSCHLNAAPYLDVAGKYLQRDPSIRHYLYQDIDGLADRSARHDGAGNSSGRKAWSWVSKTGNVSSGALCSSAESTTACCDSTGRIDADS